MRILIIEDDAGMRELLRGYLAPLGVPIEEAASLAEGVEIMRKVPPPDLIFLDLWLPDTANAQATLREGITQLKGYNADAVIVVMTGDSAESVARTAREFGADAFRHKMQMDSQASLLRVVKSALETRRDASKKTGRELARAGHEMIEQLAGLLAIDRT